MFKNVSYIKGLQHNLISISQLCDDEYNVHFNRKEGKVIDQMNVTLLTGNRQNDTYFLDMFIADNSLIHWFLSHAQSNLNWLWHKRISSLNFKNISKMSGNQLMRGIPKMKFFKDKLYSTYEKGKPTKSSFNHKSCSSINNPFHLHHMNLFGPIPFKSWPRKKFTLLTMDEFSRFTWVIFLRKKSHAANEIISLIKKWEVIYDQKVRKLWSDHGIKFINSTLEDFFMTTGISQKFSVVITHQKSRVAERWNRNLIKYGQTMVVEDGLPLSFWVAVNTICYTQNRYVIMKHYGKTSYELLKGRKPNISYVQVFECVYYIPNQRDQRSKFEAKDDEGLFLGYSIVTKSFRVFNLSG